MKTFLVVAAAACVAVVFMGVVPNNAQEEENNPNPRCPPNNGTEGACNRWQLPLLRALICKIVCLRCHGEEVLTRTLGCLVGRGRDMKCVCVGNGNNGTTTTTPTTNVTTTTATPTTPSTPSTVAPTTTTAAM